MGCHIFRSDLPLGLGSETGRTTRAGVVTDLCFPCCFGCSLVVRIRVGSGVGEESQFLGVEKLKVRGGSPGERDMGVDDGASSMALVVARVQGRRLGCC
ncbi:hypothetical protein V6N12_028156 [Hibiscus sabdariffa]|uniref:Uncharacterized protein n=1 Tax=Hibiscus sabdariffa TaxID=183260 RepID=A0ABR2F528_9ROSI